jgi:hypothetical protein
VNIPNESAEIKMDGGVQLRTLIAAQLQSATDSVRNHQQNCY